VFFSWLKIQRKGSSIKGFSFQFFDTKKGIWSSQYPDQKPFMMQLIIDTTPYPFFL